MGNKRDLRFPKQFGDFAESLVMYVLGLQNWSVALIDHVGADIIAIFEDGQDKMRLAISVKGRNFPKGESKSFEFDCDNIKKLKETAILLGMIPTVSFVFVDNQEEIKKIRIIIAKLSVLERLANDENISFVTSNKKGGIQIKYTQSERVNHLENIKQTEGISYTELAFTFEN